MSPSIDLKTKSNCPHCGQEVDIASLVPGQSEEHQKKKYPAVGDYSLCLECAAVNKFGEGGILLPLSNEEETELAQDKKQRLSAIQGKMACATTLAGARGGVLLKTGTRLRDMLISPYPPADGKEYTLQELQAAVGGMIEIPQTNDFLDSFGLVLVVNEEGKLNDLPVNLLASLFYGLRLGDIIVGQALLARKDTVK